MRLFIGIPIKDKERETIYQCSKKFVNLSSQTRIVDPSLYHLTLLFLGELDVSSVDQITHALKKITLPQFTFKLNHLGVFQKPDGQVFWLGLKQDHPQLLHLQKQVKHVIMDLDIPFTPTPFKAHLTLARKTKIDVSLIKNASISIDILVDSIVLYHSHRIDQKLTYTPLSTIYLEEHL